MTQKLSDHLKLQIWCVFVLLDFKDAHSSSHPLFFHFGQELHGHLLPQSGGFDAPFEKASGERKFTYHAFENGLYLYATTISRKKAILHPWTLWSSMICGTSLGLAHREQFLNPCLPNTLCGVPRHHASALVLCPPATQCFCNKFEIMTSRVISSSSQVLFLEDTT